MQKWQNKVRACAFGDDQSGPAPDASFPFSRFPGFPFSRILNFPVSIILIIVGTCVFMYGPTAAPLLWSSSAQSTKYSGLLSIIYRCPSIHQNSSDQRSALLSSLWSLSALWSSIVLLQSSSPCGVVVICPIILVGFSDFQSLDYVWILFPFPPLSPLVALKMAQSPATPFLTISTIVSEQMKKNET